MGNNKDIDIRIIKKYLMTEKDELKLKSFLRLYSNYSKLANFNQNQLESFENEIYTIGREFGSLGKKVGEELAERLGIKIYNKELLAEAAKSSGLCEEIFENHDEKPTNSFLYSLHNPPVRSDLLQYR